MISAQDIDELITHLCSWGLGGGPTEPAALDDRIDLGALTDVVQRERVTGVVIRAIDDGALVTESASSRIRELGGLVAERHVALLSQTLLAEVDLVRVVRRLHGAGIEHRVIKGLATAHLDYVDPAERVTSDVDLLVRPDQLAAATDAVSTQVDWNDTMPDRRASHTERYVKDRTLKLLSGGTLDLHRLLAPGYWGLITDHRRFFEQGDPYEVAATPMVALGREHRFIHALLHVGFSDEIKLQSIRDVAVLAEQLDRPVETVLDDPWLRPIHASLAEGARRTATRLHIDPRLSEWSRTIRPHRRERLALRAAELGGSRSHWTGALAIAPWELPRFGAALAFPSRRYLDWYGKSRADQLRSGWSAISNRVSR